jgi:hypothetical protein
MTISYKIDGEAGTGERSIKILSPVSGLPSPVIIFKAGD